ncbi:M23 family metallopeptidase [Cryptosporangium arvum]|uniref:M23 family metallopeptidase n=1 Tax=Cryptosporangium arvum TaxID=80871 RepID=UPI000A001E7C|nr:M23 family metallopeptidase [Cryptosporangium arvum]
MLLQIDAEPAGVRPHGGLPWAFLVGCLLLAAALPAPGVTRPSTATEWSSSGRHPPAEQHPPSVRLAPGLRPAAVVAAPTVELSRRWPLDGPVRVVRPFDPPAGPYGPGHRGVDLAGSPGTLVRAAADGVVRFAGPVGGRGVVSITHDADRRTTYEPVRASVRTGDRVVPGTPLGQLEGRHPGCPTETCLHWGLIVSDQYVDPLTLLRPTAVRLYPAPDR